MKELSVLLQEHLLPGTARIDGHLHFCSHRGAAEYFAAERAVCFPDIELDHVPSTEQLISLYKEHYDPKNVWMLVGSNMDEVETIYNKIGQQMRLDGVGELKLYDSFNGQDVNRKKISFARGACKFASAHGNLPVYIHYELTTLREAKAFERLLSDFPDIPIVLCHCGMNETNHNFAWGQCMRLAPLYQNLWFDVSWDACRFFMQNPLNLKLLPQDRVFWGSDISPRLIQHGWKSATYDEIMEWKTMICSQIYSDRNLKRLFPVLKDDTSS